MEQAQTILSAFSGLFIVAIFFLAIFRIKLATGLSIFYLSFSPFIIGLIYLYAFPPNEIQGSVSPVIPILIGVVLVLTSLALITPFIPNRSSAQNTEPKATRWLFLVGGYFIHCLGIAVSLIFWFAPEAFGNQEPSAINGVISYNIFTIFSALLMYLASRKNSEERPNLMRKIITLLVVLGVSQVTLVLSLILIYAFPSEPLMSYPNEAAYNFIASVTWGGLLLIMNRETVIEKKITSGST
jgi:hypothetical protein